MFCLGSITSTVFQSFSDNSEVDMIWLRATNCWAVLTQLDAEISLFSYGISFKFIRIVPKHMHTQSTYKLLDFLRILKNRSSYVFLGILKYSYEFLSIHRNSYDFFGNHKNSFEFSAMVLRKS